MTPVDMDGDVPSTPRQLLENLLGQGMVMVTIDARAEGAVVPRQFERDPQLRLNLSYRFGLPIEVDEWGVKARLTFSGVPFDCELPWPSIYMIVSHVTGQPFLFPEHVPHELMQLATQMRAQEAEDPTPKKPRLTIVTADDGSAEATEPEPGSQPHPQRQSQPRPQSPPRPEVARTDAGDDDGDETTTLAPPSDTAPESDAAPESDPPRTPPRRGHLRVVK
jgi:stringent starvation protein B